MEKSGIREQVIQEIRALAQKYHVQKVILFGSRARGDHRRTSDIDLAVKGGEFERFALDVEEETSTLLKYDIVDLDSELPPELRESIQKEGIVLYEKI
ncbi:MAG TPA: nucleotidyltransferase domain-containing protein [Candidatus Scatomonas merdavium]|nr:nucleotidyltransferase domain-containing protein [Candidatus Scatomonas merdavium]